MNEQTAAPTVSAAPVTGNSAAAEETIMASGQTKYHVSESGLFVRIEGKDGKMHKVKLCSAIRVEACSRDDQQANWGRLIAFRDPDGHEHRFNVQMQRLSGNGDAVISDLMDRGVVVSQEAGAKKHIIDYLLNTQPEKRARTVNKTGWYNQQFVLPEQVIGSGIEMLLYQRDSQASHAYRCQGTLQEWQLQVARPCVGNSRLVLAVSTAFAAPLLEYVNGESGGVSLTGGSSTGKTTALHVAASVCGAPEYLQRWRATSNGLESVAMLHNDCLLILDELAQIDPREAGETAYMLANGAGKIRATRSGGAKGKTIWRLLFLSAGEVSLAEHIAAAGKIARAGQEIRLVDVPADAGKGLGLFEQLHGHHSGAQLSEALKLASSRFYGIALVEFLDKLTKENDFILKFQLEEYQQQFLDQLDLKNAGGQARRVAARFAIIAAGGELATSLGVTGWEAGEAINSAVICFNAWVDGREGTGQQEQQKMLEQALLFFELHGESRFSLMDDDSPSTKTIQRAGFREFDAATGTYTYYVLTSVWSKEICKGFNPKAMAACLLEKGMLKPGRDNKLYHTRRLPGVGPAKCYEITGALFGSAEEQEALSLALPLDLELSLKQEAGNSGNTGNSLFDDNDIPF